MTPPDILGSPWRTGRRNGHTIYAQLGLAPSDQDPFVGSLNTPEAAAGAVAAWNAQRAAEAERDADVSAAVSEGARYERERIAEAASKMATTLTRPGMGNGTVHGEQVRVIPLDDLLDLINGGGEERT